MNHIKTIILTALIAFALLVPATSAYAGWAESLPPATAEEAGGGRTALFMFDYSFGNAGATNNCFTCLFLQNFLVAMASFSAAIFMYFRAFFMTLIPFFMTIWIAYSVGRLMINAGAGGKEFAYDLIKKSTVFFFLWLIMLGDMGVSRDPSETMIATSPEAPWSYMGPGPTAYAFQLGNELRNTAAASLSGAFGADLEQQIDMGCNNIGNLNAQLRDNADSLAFAHEASELACAIERTHIVGMASGLAMIEGAWSQIQTPGWSLSGVMNFFASLFNAFFLTIVGLFLIVVFALSAIWLVFQILDVVVKIMIIAAAAPLLLLFALLAPTRQYAFTAVRHVIGSMATAFSLALIATLAFYLIINTVDVYNAAIGIYDDELVEIDGLNPISELREFILRMQIDDASDEYLIPMNLTTPWFHYLVLVSLSIFALGKKILMITEQIIGASAGSEMADKAKSGAVMGAKSAAVGGLITGGVMAAGGMMAARGAAMGAGGAYAGYQAAKTHGIKNGLFVNPFGNAVNAARNAPGALAGAVTQGVRNYGDPTKLKEAASNMAKNSSSAGAKAAKANYTVSGMNRVVDDATDVDSQG